ncbi:uncharacterized protein YALI1_B03299g [Yarrowia lipolytica]|uniref:Uncharacterized protein n=1 Tax=Yarrowia lipolytica TaxID=4952 RepID=A0A1D8N652_YARLL|nr:hypothetical protein YALI1_B03299g [Yarrowia lipolytica]
MEIQPIDQEISECKHLLPKSRTSHLHYLFQVSQYQLWRELTQQWAHPDSPLPVVRLISIGLVHTQHQALLYNDYRV